MMTRDDAKAAEVLAALESAVELAFAAGFDWVEILDTVGAMVIADLANPGTE